MPRKRLLSIALDAAIVLLLFDITGRVFRDSTGSPQAADSTYSLVVAEKWLDSHTMDLAAHIPTDPVLRRGMQGYVSYTDLPYQFVRFTDPRHPDSSPAVYYGYPLGSTILSLPLVRYYVSKRGLTMFLPDGRPNTEVESLVQQRIAARVSAAIVALFYVIARFFCSPLAAVLLAVGFGLGSPVWSTMSRSLWSHTWMVFWLSVAIVLLLVARRRSAPGWAADLLLGIALGTALFWMAFTRPHAVLSAGAIGVYLLLHQRRFLAVAVVTGAAWAAGLVAVSLSTTGVPLPPSVYQPQTIDGHEILSRFAWLMASPSRGLLVFCPYLVVVAWLLVGYRRHLTERGLLVPAGLAIGAHTLLFSAYNGWHAGSSYGPRYFCDVLPWFVLAAAMGVRAMSRAVFVGFPWRKVVEATVLVASVAWAIFFHARGANAPETWEWNYLARTETEEGAAKDWRHPQFLAGITFRVRPDGTVEEW